MDVDDGEIRGLLPMPPGALEAGRRDPDLVPASLERAAERVGEAGLIVYDQDAGHQRLRAGRGADGTVLVEGLPQEHVEAHVLEGPPSPWRRCLALREVYWEHLIKVAVGALRP